MRRHDTSQAVRPPIACANPACDSQITDPNRIGTYSFILALATRGPDPRLGAFQCPSVDEIQRGNLDAQHFCCSIDCMRAILLECFEHDIIDIHNQQVAALAQIDAQAAEQARLAQEAAKDVS